MMMILLFVFTQKEVLAVLLTRTLIADTIYSGSITTAIISTTTTTTIAAATSFTLLSLGMPKA